MSTGAPVTNIPLSPSLPGPGLSTEEAGKMPISLSSLGRDLITYFISCCLRVGLLIFISLGTGCRLPRSRRSQRALLSPSPSSLQQWKTRSPASRWKELYTQIVPQLLELPPGGHKPRSPDSDSNGAGILNSTRTRAEK